MMDWRISYHDLCNEIEILEIRLNGIMDELNAHRRRVQRLYQPAVKLVASYSGMPGTGFTCVPFDVIGNNIVQLAEEADDIKDVLSLKREAKDRIEKRMFQFEGLEHRVMVMRDVQRKPLTEIAEELGYTYDYIRKVSSKIHKMYKVNVKKGTITAHTG